MPQTAPSSSLEVRLAAVERRQRGIDKELADIREIVANGYDLLFELNGDRAKSITAIVEFLHDIEMRLGPTFSKVFPKHESYLDAVEKIAGRPDEA